MITRVDKAIFNPRNMERIEKIITSGDDTSKLAEVPPLFIVMDTTWRCNYKCSLCVDTRVVNQRLSDLPVPIIKDLFDYCAKNSVWGVMTMGGETFLYRQGAVAALKKSIEHQIPLKTVTNGSALSGYIPLIQEAYKIPGSMLRVSINSDKEHYRKQTGGRLDLERVLDSIKRITSTGTNVFVSTVVFPESSSPEGVPNVFSLSKIINYCEQAGVCTHILIPARDTKDRRRFPMNAREIEEMEKIRSGNYGLELESANFFRENTYKNQNLNFTPCPSNFLFTLIGSDGKVYKCTDNRGTDSMVIGKIEKPGDFEEFWHSPQRVENQFCTICPNKGCMRYKINCILEHARDCFKERGADMFTDYLALQREIFLSPFI